PADFYPSALAIDPVHGRYLVGSFHNGEVAVLDRTGRRLGTLRKPAPGERVLRLRVEGRTLWVALPRTIEAIDLDDPQRPRAVYRLQASVHYADMAIAGDRIYLLDAREGQVYALDHAQRVAYRYAALPERAARPQPAACLLSDETAEPAGALLLTPQRDALLIALNGALYRLDLVSRRIEAVRMHLPMTHVSQLLYRGLHAGRHEVVAIRGMAARTTHLRLDASFRRVLAQESFRVASAAPMAAAADGARLRLVLGSLRHHPLHCGDGRPNTAIRLVSYPSDKTAEAWRLAAARDEQTAPRTS